MLCEADTLFERAGEVTVVRYDEEGCNHRP